MKQFIKLDCMRKSVLFIHLVHEGLIKFGRCYGYPEA